MPTNQEFLQALFAEDAPFAHITDFMYDPSNIPSDKHLIAWKGDWASRYTLTEGSNQYFTISIFSPDEKGIARRRKVNFLRTRVIVLDDVKEKLSLVEAQKLPEPAWILETSPGSEQWGYILNEPCTERHRVENLLDGLIANGLSPDGKDSGMKGVTRYVRLPEGYNHKITKLVDGEPFKCRMLLWEPERRSSMEELAAPLSVNLDAVRREGRIDGAADIPDHPILQLENLINVKEVRSDGRFDITCPWVEGHTGQDDSGAAIFTNDDGSIGFKCHHGSCHDRNGGDLLRYIEQYKPGFGNEFKAWQMKRMFASVDSASTLPTDLPPSVEGTDAVSPPLSSNGIDEYFDMLRREVPSSPQARDIAEKLLHAIESMPVMERDLRQTEVADAMRWTKTFLKEVLKDLRKQWYADDKKRAVFLSSFLFVKELNQFYDCNTRIFYRPEAFQNAFNDLDPEVRKTALEMGQVEKVDKLDFVPRSPRVFTERNVKYGNSWSAIHTVAGVPGDCNPWLRHWEAMGWGEHQEHMLKWMAYTIQHPERKINHVLLLGGREGVGKDYLLYPLVKAVGEYSTTISGIELLSDFDDYLLSAKHLHINETELGDHRQAKEVSARLKPLAAAPPDKLRPNPKGIARLQVRNIVNCTMSTNSTLPVQINSTSRRFYAVWTDLIVRDEHEEMYPDWAKYWEQSWAWMENGGYAYCIDFLMKLDVSKFNPGAPPPMTEFLREIREESKSPAQVTIENFANRKIGALRADLVTASDVAETIQSVGQFDASLMNAAPDWFTCTRVGKVMSSVDHFVKKKAGRSRTRIWIIRDMYKYRMMTPAELLKEYENQKAAVRLNQKRGLTSV